jgi:hypothetical protein
LEKQGRAKGVAAWRRPPTVALSCPWLWFEGSPLAAAATDTMPEIAISAAIVKIDHWELRVRSLDTIIVRSVE